MKPASDLVSLVSLVMRAGTNITTPPPYTREPSDMTHMKTSETSETNNNNNLDIGFTGGEGGFAGKALARDGAFQFGGWVAL